MKRSDWLTNKEPERAPRPKRLFELTDAIIKSLNFHYGDRLNSVEDILIDYFESLPKFFKQQKENPARPLSILSNNIFECPGLNMNGSVKAWTLSGNGEQAVLFVKTTQAFGAPAYSHQYIMGYKDGKWTMDARGMEDSQWPQDYDGGGWQDTNPPTYIESTQWPTNPFAETEWNSTGPGLGTTTVTSTGGTTSYTIGSPGNRFTLTSGDTNGQSGLDPEQTGSIVNWDEDDDIPF